jgi:bifunctional enzyme CysN/CysC
MQLADERDISRGDMIVRPNNVPFVSNSFDAMVAWFDVSGMKQGKRYIIKHTTKQTFGVIEELQYELDIDSLHRKETDILPENGVGKAHIVTNEPLFYDLYATNRYTGSFIMIDPDTYQTAGAGVIIKAKQDAEVQEDQGTIVWFTGLSGSGKSTIADGVYQKLKQQGKRVARLDGDVMREAFGDRLGFSEADRRLNVDIAAFTARQLALQGVTVLVSFISPYRDQREAIKKSYQHVVEVFVDTPLEVCEERDVKGLYKKARAGEISEFTGITSPYEVPKTPDIKITTVDMSVVGAIEIVVSSL